VIGKINHPRRHSKRQKRSRLKNTPQTLPNQPWLIAILAWLAIISFIITVPPRFWWQITIGLLLFFASLALTIKAISQSLVLSLVVAGFITLLPTLKILNFLTLKISLLTVFAIILLIGHYLLKTG